MLVDDMIKIRLHLATNVCLEEGNSQHLPTLFVGKFFLIGKGFSPLVNPNCHHVMNDRVFARFASRNQRDNEMLVWLVIGHSR